MPRSTLALDHNFPEPILACLDQFIVDLKLVPLRHIDRRLPALDDDRKLLIALYQLGYRGLVTNNYKMLLNPEELAAILRTGITVFAIEGVGHDPLRATGALLLDLPGAVRRWGGDGRVFQLRPRNPQPTKTWDLFRRAAEHLDRSPNELYSEVKVTDEELVRPQW